MVKFVDRAPTAVVRTGDAKDISEHLQPQDVEEIAEIFHTPLTGAYTWNYLEADKKLRKLYRLGKERNWNADVDLDWTQTLPHSTSPADRGRRKSLRDVGTVRRAQRCRADRLRLARQRPDGLAVLAR